MHTKVNKAVAAFLRALSAQLENGTCELSDSTMTNILNAVATDRDRGHEENKATLVESLGRAYSYLSERQTELEERITDLESQLIGNKTIQFPRQPR